MKILIIATMDEQLSDTGRKTGLWLEELAVPYYSFKDAGSRHHPRQPQRRADSPGSQKRIYHCLHGYHQALSKRPGGHLSYISFNLPGHHPESRRFRYDIHYRGTWPDVGLSRQSSSATISGRFQPATEGYRGRLSWRGCPAISEKRVGSGAGKGTTAHSFQRYGRACFQADGSRAFLTGIKSCCRRRPLQQERRLYQSYGNGWQSHYGTKSGFRQRSCPENAGVMEGVVRQSREPGAAELILLFIHHLFGLDAQRSMGDGSQSRFIDQFTGYPANTIGLILNTHDGLFEMVDKSDLPAGHLAQLLPFHTHTSIFHGHVPRIVIIPAHFILARN